MYRINLCLHSFLWLINEEKACCHRRTGTFGLGGGGGGGDPVRKNYPMSERVSVEIGMETHSKGVKNKTVHKDSYIESLHFNDLYQKSLNLVKCKTYQKKKVFLSWYSFSDWLISKINRLDDITEAIIYSRRASRHT